MAPTNTSADSQEKTARTFNHHMLQGKVTAALRIISKDTKGGVLLLDELVPSGMDQNGETIWHATKEILMEKHPLGKPALPETLLPVPTADDQRHNPIIFQQITGEAIRQAALHTHGAAGPSGVEDAFAWHRFCTSFKSASNDLCNALAAVAKRQCTSDVHPEGLTALVACHLIHLNKNPGVRPIGIGEVP